MSYTRDLSASLLNNYKWQLNEISISFSRAI